MSLTAFSIPRLTDAEVQDVFRQARWDGGIPTCTACGMAASITLKGGAKFRCKSCRRDFSVTSGTAFDHCRMELAQALYMMAVFVNASSGTPVESLRRATGAAASSIDGFLRKQREVMAREQAGMKLTGRVEIDGGWFGGHGRPANRAMDRVDLRRTFNRNGKEQCIVVLRQRGGPALTAVFKHENLALQFIRDHVDAGTVLYTDQANHWAVLSAFFDSESVNHKLEYVRYDKGRAIHTNGAESFIGRLRDMENVYGHISGPHLADYAAEMTWRVNHADESPEQRLLSLLSLALRSPPSEKHVGRYQRVTGHNLMRQRFNSRDPRALRHYKQAWEKFKETGEYDPILGVVISAANNNVDEAA